MFAVLYNLAESSHLEGPNIAIAIGPFRALHTVAQNEFRMLPLNVRQDVVDIDVTDNYEFRFGKHVFTDLNIVEGQEFDHNAFQYAVEVVSLERYEAISATV